MLRMDWVRWRQGWKQQDQEPNRVTLAWLTDVAVEVIGNGQLFCLLSCPALVSDWCD